MRFENGLEVNRIEIAALFREVSALVENVSDAAAHAGCKISSAGSEHQHKTFRHVLATVIADAFDYRGRSRIANGKALAGYSVEKRFAAGCAVKCNVAYENVFLGGKFRSPRRICNQTTARQALAYVVVRVAFERESNSFGQKRSHALAGGAIEMNSNRVVGQTG